MWITRGMFIAAWTLLFATAGSRTVEAAPSLRVETQRVLMPLVTERDLDASYSELDPARGHFAILIDITVPKTDPRGWALFLRADRPVFMAEGTGKLCSDLEWKLDEAPAADYRGLDENETLVLADPAGGNARVLLDVRVRIDWLTEAGAYDLGLLFHVAPY
ncbi:MAG: hypothetical protein R3E12_00970 [Candidatus Eisenbacteria bacterium]|uniref:Uncharacterized protein n=1 Tax=Eiseniibacteriota bacterium TaxID=2212470 RepID=A0A956M3P7_UNCEI|nr:hypothetical protein [Candidatus Eisenbacteria bacterium]